MPKQTLPSVLQRRWRKSEATLAMRTSLRSEPPASAMPRSSRSSRSSPRTASPTISMRSPRPRSTSPSSTLPRPHEPPGGRGFRQASASPRRAVMSYGFLDIAVTPSVRAAQAQMGADRLWVNFKGRREFKQFTENESAFIAQRDSFYIASVSEAGWPYVQHRGGPRGFL